MNSMALPIHQLCIWQQNLNKSTVVQHSLLNSSIANQQDIIVIQEPAIDHCIGLTKANSHWRVLYLTHNFTIDATPRAVTLVNAKLSTNNWEQIPFPFRDVIIVQFHGAHDTCTLFNVYNDGMHNRTLEEMGWDLTVNIEKVHLSQGDHMF